MEDYEFGELDRWISLFPLGDVPSEHVLGWGIVGPGHLAEVEQARTKAARYGDLGETVPTDVLVFAGGSPRRRDVTKVGGLPYRPREKPWPTTADGVPMTFLAQYRFVESRDIIGETPGDILLVFAADEDSFWDDAPNRPAFEWYPLGLKQLIRRKEIPEPLWKFSPCYGHRCRTVDYVERCALEAILKSLPPEAADMDFSEAYSWDPLWQVTGAVAKLIGMKIGGAPHWNRPHLVRPGVDCPGRFLCSLSTIIATSQGPYPWVNHPEPFSGKEWFSKVNTFLSIVDGFILNFSLDENGKVHWCFQPTE